MFVNQSRNHNKLFKSSSSQNGTNKWTELLLGVILIIAATLGWFYNPSTWGAAALTFLEGAIIWFAIMLGIVFVLLGISDLKS